LVEEPVAGAGQAGMLVPRHSLPEPLKILHAETEPMMATGVAELDRVLGGGLVSGSITLIGGEPGIGKSTLVLQALAGLAGTGRRCLLVAAEESPAQVRRRATRLGATVPGLWMVAETSMSGLRAAVADVSPDVLVIDSIQTVWDPDLESGPGSVAQVRGCAHQLAALAKAGGPAVVLLGHVTKDGALAGPRVLEHLVDTVVSFEGDRHHALRLLRALKHRFGATGELGVFEMTAAGLVEVDDPGRMFLADRCGSGPGSVVFASMDGHRPLLVEIQALVASSPAASPRRSASGFDLSRLAMLLAVLDRRAGLRLSAHEVYVSVVGGVKLSDPGADLAVCLAIASSASHQSVDSDTVVVGEVGLGGEVRQVAGTPQRLGEAARLGFVRAVVPAHAPPHPGLRTAPVGNLGEALDRHLGRTFSLPRLRVVR
jgi:DNA repair protein RadA/Sms